MRALSELLLISRIIITGMEDKEEFYNVIIEEKKDILDVEKDEKRSNRSC